MTPHMSNTFLLADNVLPSGYSITLPLPLLCSKKAVQGFFSGVIMRNAKYIIKTIPIHLAINN